MPEATEITLIDGVRIVVPDSLDLITPYVLREQQDFFEDELKFIRRLLEPGQKVIDIGANYGVYTLPMAHRVGADGHVWAFEPASQTAQFLAQGIKANSFANVTLEQKALSSAPGSAQLSLQYHSELNSIVHGRSLVGEYETVSLVTLDECTNRYRWSDIELIKMDAEGEENNIVKGGRRLLAEQSPLLQYELRKDATNMNFGLIRELAAIGYESYRLVPGLNLLVPFDAESQPDPYQLNLFSCKLDRAARLASRSLLLRTSDVDQGEKRFGMNASGLKVSERYHWRQTLARLPYASSLTPAWTKAESDANSSDLLRGLSLYARSRDLELPPAERFLALKSSFATLKAVCEREPVRLRLASFSRIAHDYGERAISVNALKGLLDHIRHAGVDPSEPFLAPLERFESISFGEEPARWIVAAALEQLERRERFSSFYAGPAARERLEDIHALGYSCPEMERRLELIRLRFDRASPPRA
jgi:FkbM family methyltransferase